MNKRIRGTAAVIGSCVLLFCVKNGPAPQKTGPCIVDNDTITIDKAQRLVPDTLPPAKKMFRAVLQCVLRKQSEAAAPSVDNSGFYMKLSQRLGDAWTPATAFSLYHAARILYDKSGELGSASRLAAWLDSLVSSSASCADSAVLIELRSGDSLLKSLDDGAVRENREKVLERTLRLRPVYADILADYMALEDVKRRKAAETGGELGARGPAARALAVHGTRPPRAEHEPTPEFALRYRPQQSIRDSIGRHLLNLRSLYKKRLKIHESLAGTVWATFVVSPDGRVTSVQITSTEISEKDFLNPLADYLKTMHFSKIPDKAGAMTFDFPFDFSPEPR